jgi:Ca2+-binding EF-hand superfamily protein
MKYFNKLILPTAVFMIWCCSSPQVYSSYTNWDGDGNRLVDRYEFTRGYMQSDYFKKWTEGNLSMNYNELYNKIFNNLDSDNDNLLSMSEFNSRINHFYFQMFNGNFSQWDHDANSLVDRNEFIEQAGKTKLGSIWDTSDDRTITEREMAGGMFYICDADNNGRIDSLEFNTWADSR